MARELKPCGTPAAYLRHVRQDEDPCDSCKAAHSARVQRFARARRRALARLAEQYSEAFAALIAEERAKEGLS